jgi:hypothetical protein
MEEVFAIFKPIYGVTDAEEKKKIVAEIAAGPFKEKAAVLSKLLVCDDIGSSPCCWRFATSTRSTLRTGLTDLCIPLQDGKLYVSGDKPSHADALVFCTLSLFKSGFMDGEWRCYQCRLPCAICSSSTRGVAARVIAQCHATQGALPPPGPRTPRGYTPSRHIAAMCIQLFGPRSERHKHKGRCPCCAVITAAMHVACRGSRTCLGTEHTWWCSVAWMSALKP